MPVKCRSTRFHRWRRRLPWPSFSAALTSITTIAFACADRQTVRPPRNIGRRPRKSRSDRLFDCRRLRRRRKNIGVLSSFLQDQTPRQRHDIYRVIAAIVLRLSVIDRLLEIFLLLLLGLVVVCPFRDNLTIRLSSLSSKSETVGT